MTATQAYKTLPARYTLRSSGDGEKDPNLVAKWLKSAIMECGGQVEKTQTIGQVAIVTFATDVPRDTFRADLYETIGMNWNMRKAR
jgi:hypothetical protein